MKLARVLFIITTFLHASPLVGALTAISASRLFHELDFAMASDEPGTVVAVRLKPQSKSKPVTICFRGECTTVSHDWQLLATDPNGPAKQLFTLEDETHAYAFRRIGFKDNIFTQAHKPVTKLRLPASVVTEIDKERDLIRVQDERSQELFKLSQPQPWSSQWMSPVKGHVVSLFHSERVPPHGQPYNHTGVDLRAPKGSPVRATSDGVVIATNDEVIGGHVVTIDHGRGVMSRYMHLSKFLVKPGDRVKTGEVIALSGSTGRAEAPHLHWEIRIRGRPVDPVSTQRLLARLYDLE